VLPVCSVGLSRPRYTAVTGRADRLVLGLEIALGIVPITMVGGLYATIGMYFGGAAIAVSIAQRSLSGSTLWLGIMALAAGGLAGIVGLWALVLVTISSRPPDRVLMKTAIVGSVAGVATAALALIESLSASARPSATIVALLVAPVLVVVHRLPAIVRSLL